MLFVSSSNLLLSPLFQLGHVFRLALLLLLLLLCPLLLDRLRLFLLPLLLCLRLWLKNTPRTMTHISQSNYLHISDKNASLSTHYLRQLGAFYVIVNNVSVKHFTEKIRRAFSQKTPIKYSAKRFLLVVNGF